MKIVSSFDDAGIYDIEIVRLLARHGLTDTCTMYWPVMPTVVNEPRGRISLSLQQMQEIAKSITIGSHTITHPLLTRISIEQANDEIYRSRIILQERFQQEIQSFAYPRGYSRPEIQKVVQDAGYKTARGVTVGSIHNSENIFDMQTTVHIGYQRNEYNNVPWFDYALSMLQLAKRTPDSVYHFWGHSEEINRNNAWEDFERLLQELKNI